MFTLETFGGLSLRGADGPITNRAGQRRRLALLAVLAVERRAISRDKLLGFLWPEADSERGRRLLADSLYVLRSGLGDDAIRTFGDDVSLNEECIATDVSAFLRAIDDGDFERAAATYTAPFLDGIFISDAPEFERWAESTRSRLAGEHRRCLERLATDADVRQSHMEAVRWWRELAGADPVSSRAAVGLIRALAAAGDRAAALQFARVHEEIVRGELDSPPDPVVSQLVSELRLAPDRVPAPTTGAAPASPALVSTTEPATVLDATTPPIVGTAPSLTRRHLARRPMMTAGAIGLLFVAIVIRSCAYSSSPVGPSQLRIVVLPFTPIGASPEAAYVAEAIVQDLTTDLSSASQLRVVSHTSAVAASAMRLTSSAIGDSLGARYLVEGSVRIDGNKVHVAAALIEARDHGTLWTHEFDPGLSPTAVFDTERAIARAIAATLHIGPANGWATSPATRAPANMEALDFYMRGRQLLDLRSRQGATRAVQYFTRAIAEDSTYALAYAGLSDAYAVFGIGNIGDDKADEYFPLARDAAAHALRLDSTLAAAHASLGYFELLYNLEWDKASGELSKALALQPSNSTTHIYRAVLAEWTREFDVAVTEAESAFQNDRLAPATIIELGRAFFFAGDDRKAEARFRSALDFDSTLFRAHLHLGQVLVHEHRFDEGIAELRTAARLSTNSSRPLALLAHAYASAGRRADAMLLLDTLEARRASRYVPAFDFAIVYAGLRDTTKAVQWLNKSLEDHSIRPYVMDPTFDGIRRAEPFRRFIATLDLPTGTAHR